MEVIVHETFVAIPVADMDRATAFWVAALGASIAFASPRWTSLHVAGVRVALFLGPAGATGLHFVVDDVSGAAIVAAGGGVAAPVEAAPGVVVAQATDTEGNVFTLVRGAPRTE